MKTTLAAFLLACFAAVPAAAQPAPPTGASPAAPVTSQTRLGLRAGLNFSSVRSDDLGGVSISSRVGFAIGGALLYEVNPSVSLAVEGVFTQKGAKFSDGVDSITVKYNYVEFPFLGAYRFQTNGSVAPFVFGGGAIAVFLSGEASAGGESADLTDVNSIDFGVVAGAGVQIQRAGGATGVIDFRYTLGLNDIADEGDGSAQHGVISVMGGYLF